MVVIVFKELLFFTLNRVLEGKKLDLLHSGCFLFLIVYSWPYHHFNINRI